MLAGYVWISPAAAYDSDTEANFHVDYEYQKERVEDFYRRFVEIENMDKERRRGEDEKRKERQQYIKEYEAARREFVKERKAAPVEDPTAWEAEVKARKAQYEQSRRNYVTKRNQALQQLRKFGRVPEEDEFDLYLDGE
jgi:DNA repair exonuclease SbcCD nuclease subunit